MTRQSMDRPSPYLERLMIDAVRVLSMDAVQKANSGHPGTPMALAPLGYETWTRHLKHNPANPDWLDRDRFVLSCGHASMLLYSLLYLTGYELSLDDLVNFRQWGAPTAGHPEFGHAPGVETTTGPLGQGVANSVGMAMAERWLAEHFNRPEYNIVDHRTWVFCSDGDLMEGISHEAAAIAGHQQLGKLTWIFDDNHITIDGSTELATVTDQLKRFEAYGWHVQHVEDGNDLEAMDAALEAAVADPRPSLIGLRTIIGYGSPELAGSSKAHGAPLGEEEVAATKENLGYPSTDPFYVDPNALAEWRKTSERGARLEAEWTARFEAYSAAHPKLAQKLVASMEGKLPEGWDAGLAEAADSAKAAATRGHSGRILQVLAERIPNLVGGSADLAGSNKTTISAAAALAPATPDGRNVFYGVREHAMGAVMNGMVLHGGLRPYGGTFLIFSDYMRPAIRLAALMKLPVCYVFSHDSIGLGEDGPTHQPVEQLMSLRAIPGLVDLRPCDGPETLEAWKLALEASAPSFLALTRQGVPVLDREALASAEGTRRGGYVLADGFGGEVEAILIASGSEVGIALQAREILQADGIATRVVSLPSWSLFGAQSQEYRDQVLPPDIESRVAIEAGSTFGWARWLGPEGVAIGIDHFGASAPAEVLYEKFGLTATRVVEAVRARVTVGN